MLHPFLILLLQVTIQSDVLIGSKGLTPDVPGDQLQLCIGETAVCGQPGDRLVSERVGSRRHAGLPGVLGDNLLYPAC